MNSDYYLKVTPADLEKALSPNNTYDLPHLYHPEPNRIWRTSVVFGLAAFNLVNFQRTANCAFVCLS
jgi:hypothetical protein